MAVDNVLIHLMCKTQDLCKRDWTIFIKGLRFAEHMTESDPKDRIIGYARVSTYGQTLNA